MPQAGYLAANQPSASASDGRAGPLRAVAGNGCLVSKTFEAISADKPTLRVLRVRCSVRFSSFISVE
jgi:hypothetical protein